MSVDINYLKKRGCSPEAYKKIFSQPVEKMTDRQKKLIQLLSTRNKDGFLDSLRDYQAYQSIDLAYEVSFAQTTATLVHHILGKNLNADQTLEALKQYGLSESELFMDVPHPTTGQTVKMLNRPVFFQIYIPIVKAYCEAILAQIFNERNVSPLLPYKPLKETDRNKVLCEIVTDVVDTQSTWYGYPAVLRQSIQQMLKYGIMLAFPREEWHCEEQMVEYGDKPEVITVKEGIRYMHPHPTRMFYDLEYPLTSINTDSGCTYAAHWHILKYGDILDNRMYWNRKAIFGGTNWFQAPIVGNYFNEVYPCTLKFLDAATWGPSKREDRASYYNTTSDRDKAVFVTDHFMKLVPDDWDLTDRKDKSKGYKYPVWHRFTMAGDDTVIFASPCAYNPIWGMYYDYDEMTARNTSFALELIPWQDHLGNILSQMLLTAKQNLLNICFYNNQVIDKQDIEKMNNAGEMKYRGIMMMGYDPLKMQAARVDMHDIFNQVQIQPKSIVELVQILSSTLNIMERVLGISAQATGSAASHQQSKAEIVQTGVSSGNRVQKISSSVDEGIDAWKRQLYEGYQAYGDGKIVAEVSTDVEDLETHLQELGFEVKGKGSDSVLVEGHKKVLRLEGFAASNKGPKTEHDKETAAIIAQAVSQVAGQPDLHKAIGAKNLLKMLEWSAKLAGAPRDFRLRIDPNQKDEEVPENIQKAIADAGAQILKAVEEKIAKPIAGEMATEQQEIVQLQSAVQQLEGIYKIAAAANDKLKVKEAETSQKMTHRQQAFEAEQGRKAQAAQAEQSRKQATTIQELQAANALLQQKLDAMAAETQARIQADAAKTDATIKAKEKTAAAVK